jgi:hypothetical protein
MLILTIIFYIIQANEYIMVNRYLLRSLHGPGFYTKFVTIDFVINSHL